MESVMSKTNEHHTEGKDHKTDHFSSDLETLQSNFTQLREDVTELLNNAVGTARSGAGAIKHRASGVVDDLKDRGSDSLEQIGERIAERPFASAAIAFGVGFIAAKLLSKR
jgi:ElaB/YqjD/DUF883 family membrane-anchored ribosome-binding protein